MKTIGLAGNSTWSILNFRSNLIHELIKKGFIIHIIAPADQSVADLENLGCIVHNIQLNRRSLNPFNNLFLILRYRKIIQILKLDYILTFNIKPNLYICIASYGLSAKVIVNISGLGSTFLKSNFLTKIIQFLYKISLKNASTIFFQNKSDLNFFKEKRICKVSSLNLLPGSGIDLNKFKKNNHHLVNGSQRDLIFIGRLIRDKGIMEYLNAASYIVEEYSNASFYLYGEVDPHNPSFISSNEMKSFASEKINFMGKVQNIEIALGHASCVILPSYREGMSRSLLEAAACGIPIITTDVPGCQEIVEDSKTGLLCKAKSTQDLIVKIEKFLDLKNSEIKIMGDKARLKVEKEFSVDLVVKKYIEIIK